MWYTVVIQFAPEITLIAEYHRHSSTKENIIEQQFLTNLGIAKKKYAY